MIISLANRIQIKIDRRNELEKRRDNETNITETHQKLAEIGKMLRDLIATFLLLKPRLTDEQREEAIKRLGRINSKINESYGQFTNTTYRQVRELNTVERSIQDLFDFLQRSWVSYVLLKTKSHFELLKLVENLPEVTIKTDAKMLRHRLQSASEKVPSTEAYLKQFDDNLNLLQNSLSNLRGLTPEVKDFLDKVQKGTASIDDLTDEILAWCQENNIRAGAFKISFGQIKS